MFGSTMLLDMVNLKLLTDLFKSTQRECINNLIRFIPGKIFTRQSYRSIFQLQCKGAS